MDVLGLAVAKKPAAKITNTTQPQPGAIVPRMLNAAAAAAYLGIGTFAMRHLHWDGAVRGVFIGRKLLFDRADLDKYVDGLKAA